VSHVRMCGVTIQSDDGAIAHYSTNCQQLGRRF
jgi:hypothetical protein